MPCEFARRRLLEGGLAPRISVNYRSKFSRYAGQSLGGCSGEYPEDYQHHDYNSEDNREHQLHPLSGGFLLIQTAFCRSIKQADYKSSIATFQAVFIFYWAGKFPR